MNKLNISSSSQVGCVRNNNEDMILVVDKFLRNDTYEINLTDTDKDRFVIGLADGMGGHNGGEVASSIVVNGLTDKFKVLDAIGDKQKWNKA